MRKWRLPWVALEDVSPAMRTAIILSEDQRFWQHSGVDWQAVAASAWANLINERTRGASTVTMQLAGLLDQQAARPGGGRNWSQKVAQAWGARQLEARWRKSDILEAYLNLVPFRGELVGLPALTATLFRKHPSGLDAQEAAIADRILLEVSNEAIMESRLNYKADCAMFLQLFELHFPETFRPMRTGTFAVPYMK